MNNIIEKPNVKTDNLTSIQHIGDSEMTDIRHTALRVLKTEIKGMEALSKSLDSRFDAAIEAIESCDGRVIVTGMGKSGHIGRKIAATLASTGTPSFFVHPGEASHGDLGMFTKDDIVLAISNSGESAELADIIAYCGRYGLPLIGLTSREGSSLGKHSNFLLLLPASDEACPMGLAPTTSTTLALAMGDALAVTLLERRGFTKDDYGQYHPGGSLGKRLLRVDAIMQPSEKLPLISSDTPMSEAVIIMSDFNLGCVGIIDEDNILKGIITDGDLRRHIATDLTDTPAGEVMTPNPKTISPAALAEEAAKLMNDKRITSLFVQIDDNKAPIGIIHIHDCLRAGVL